MAEPTSPTPLVSLRGITKRYTSVLANDAIDLDVGEGEIHALLGENGAGKSTLVKIIFGVTQPDAGRISWRGQPVVIPSPHAARRLGIGMVFQHFSLFEALSVLENVAVGLEDARVDGALARRVVEVSTAYGLPLEPKRPVHGLSVGERQRIEIVRCLLQSPRLLIMDEPTSVLTPQECERLFVTLRALAADGCAILYISHKLDEVRALCEGATILRQGRVVASCDPRAESARSLARLMIGADIREPGRRTGTYAQARPRLAVQRLTLPPAGAHDLPLRDIALEVQAGEIVGIAGVAGNGQRELLEALAGERPAPAPDTIQLDGAPVGWLGPASRRRAGLCYIPEERNGTGAVGSFALADNAVLGAWQRARLVRWGMVRAGAAHTFAQRIIDQFAVRAAGTNATAASLSGGNLQKFIVGREVLQDPGVLVAAQPTWGVDAGAAAQIHAALRELADRGAAVLVVSQDLDEILALCDRLAVLNAGRLSRTLRAAETSVEQIGLLMGGLHDLVDVEGPALAATA